MNFNLVEMYNGLLRFNKHILNELAEGLKHLPNLDGVSKGDSLIINEQGNPSWGSTAFIPTFENAAYGIEWTKDDNDIIRIGNAKFHRELPIQNRLEGSYINYINMKRYNGLHDKLCIIENIEVADDNARKNKNKKYGINKHVIGVFILKVKKKKLNLKHNIL